VLADRLQMHGPDHPNTLRTRSQLAYWRGRVSVDEAPHRQPSDADPRQSSDCQPRAGREEPPETLRA
jgi:hypothetical protein